MNSLKSKFYPCRKGLLTGIFSGLLLCSSLFASAQDDTETKTYTWDDIIEQIPPVTPNPCNPPFLAKHNEVFFEEATVCEFFISGQAASNQVTFHSSSGDIVASVNSDGRGLVTNLLPDVLYEIRATDICSKPIVLGRVGDASVSEPSLDISNKLYDELAIWDLEHPTIHIAEYLSDKTEISAIERLSFLQSIIFTNKFDLTLYDELILNGTEWVINIDFLGEPVQAECKCKIVVTPDAGPATKNPANQYGFPIEERIGDDIGMGIAPAEFTDHSTYDIRDGKKDIYIHEKGPVKYAQFTHEADAKWPGETGKKGAIEFSTMDDGSTHPINYYVMKLNYICINPNNGLPTNDCPCSKSVSIHANYDAAMEARTKSEGVAANYSHAKIEEFAVLLKRNVNTGTLDIVQGNRRMIFSQHNGGLNHDWLKNATDLFTGIATTAATVATGGSFSMPSNFLSSLNGLLTNPINNTIATGDQIHAYNFVNYDQTFSLAPNEKFEYILGSATNAKLEGLYRFNGIAGVYSNADLSVYVDPAGDAGCCSKAMARWLSGTVNKAPKDTWNNRTFVGNFFGGRAPFDNLIPDHNNQIHLPTDAGRYYGPAYPGCSDPIIVSKPGIHSNDNNSSTVFGSNGTVYIDNGLSNEVQYTISDMTGRIIAKGASTGNGTKIVYSRMDNSAPAIYIVRTIENGKTKTYKLHL